jgi:NTE family protein
VLRFRPSDFVPGSGSDLERDEYRRKVVLTDGGVYDNLGLETAWKSSRTVLISDAGATSIRLPGRCGSGRSGSTGCSA